jgi:hypothetical protein
VLDAPSLPLCHPPAAGHANPRKGDMRRPVHMIKLTATQEITPQPEPVSRDQLPKPPVNEFFFIELGVGERL